MSQSPSPTPPHAAPGPFTPSRLLATWFGVGQLPLAPGTWGSLAALPFAWLFIVWGGLAVIIVAAGLATLAGIWAGGAHAAAIGRHDPGSIVIDEVAGQWLATVPIAWTGRTTEWLPWVIAFAAFRLFDITKPWPARHVERWPEGFGIMADDVVAGVYAAAVLAVILALF